MIKIAADPFGTIEPPPGVARFAGGNLGGIPAFISILLKSLIMLAGIYAILNIILAGFAYISAAGDSKAIQSATAKIWQSVLGLMVAAGAFVIAGIVGQILFGKWDALLNFKVFSPGP